MQFNKVGTLPLSICVRFLIRGVERALRMEPGRADDSRVPRYLPGRRRLTVG
jgi:hypothetical protein